MTAGLKKKKYIYIGEQANNARCAGTHGANKYPCKNKYMQSAVTNLIR